MVRLLLFHTWWWCVVHTSVSYHFSYQWVYVRLVISFGFVDIRRILGAVVVDTRQSGFSRLVLFCWLAVWWWDGPILLISCVLVIGHMVLGWSESAYQLLSNGYYELRNRVRLLTSFYKFVVSGIVWIIRGVVVASGFGWGNDQMVPARKNGLFL